MISIILFFLGKGIKAGNKLDLFIKESLEKLGDNYIVKISILNSKPCLCFWKENNKFYFKIGEKARKIKPDLEISFKNKKSARKVLFGSKSIEKAFAMHYFIVYGDIAKAMLIVPVLEKVESYLFPKFITNKIVSYYNEKTVSSFRYYLCVILGI